jgi:prepilin-type N-terminal cleavage/methylation domain-containing protein
MTGNVCSRRHRSARGFSINELMITTAIIVILSAISLPQLVGSRRILRSASITHELISELRNARQLATSRRRAITFQYDDATKQVNIIDHGTDAQGIGVSGKGVLSDPNYPNTAGSSVVHTFSLTSSGIPAGEIAYGIPSGVAMNANKLTDNTTVSALTNQKLNITFQPDETIISSAGVTCDFAFSIYNTAQPRETAVAVSILGATGRIKAWRYSSSADKFVE